MWDEECGIQEIPAMCCGMSREWKVEQQPLTSNADCLFVLHGMETLVDVSRVTKTQRWEYETWLKWKGQFDCAHVHSLVLTPTDWTRKTNKSQWSMYDVTSTPAPVVSDFTAVFVWNLFYKYLYLLGHRLLFFSSHYFSFQQHLLEPLALWTTYFPLLLSVFMLHAFDMSPRLLQTEEERVAMAILPF